MKKPMIRIHDTETNEVIDRQMTDIEFKEYEFNRLNFEARQAESETKAQAKAALLDRLGITEDEAKLLLS